MHGRREIVKKKLAEIVTQHGSSKMKFSVKN